MRRDQEEVKGGKTQDEGDKSVDRQTGERDIRRYLPDACPEGT